MEPGGGLPEGGAVMSPAEQRQDHLPVLRRALLSPHALLRFRQLALLVGPAQLPGGVVRATGGAADQEGLCGERPGDLRRRRPRRRGRRERRREGEDIALNDFLFDLRLLSKNKF